MDAAEKERLREYYATTKAEVDGYAEELRGTPLDDTREVVNREGIKIVCFEIAKFAVLTGLLHRAKDLSPEMLENYMINIFDRVRDVQWNAHRAQSKAGRYLSRIISDFTKEFTDCALHLLRCTVGYGPDGDENKVASSALKVLDEYETKVAAIPLTNTAALGEMLEWHETTIRGIPDAYERFKLGRSSTESSHDTEEKRLLRLVMGVVSGTVPVIEELRRAVKEWNESDLSKSTITGMENIAVLASRMCTEINEIMDGFRLPSPEVSDILEGVDRVNNNVIALQEIPLLHNRYASEEFAQKAASLKESIEELKSFLSDYS